MFEKEKEKRENATSWTRRLNRSTWVKRLIRSAGPRIGRTRICVWVGELVRGDETFAFVIMSKNFKNFYD